MLLGTSRENSEENKENCSKCSVPAAGMMWRCAGRSLLTVEMSHKDDRSQGDMQLSSSTSPKFLLIIIKYW